MIEKSIAAFYVIVTYELLRQTKAREILVVRVLMLPLDFV